MDLNQLLEAINKATTELRSYVDRQIEEVRKSGAASDDTKAAIEKANAEIGELRKALDEAVKAAQRPGNGATGNEDPKDRELRSAYSKFLRYGAGENGRSMMSVEEIRALSQASDAEGGFLVPTAWESGLITQAYDAAEIRPLCDVAPTGRDTVFMPALAKPTVAWGTVNVAVDPQSLGAGGERMSIYDLKGLVLIHNNTLDDADADIWGELQMQFSDAIAAALSDSTHNGIDPLITALYLLKKTYRRNATWIFNSNTEAVIRTLKDANGQYLWQPPVQAGAPATLLGRPIANAEGMPDIAANAFPIAIGDCKRGYRIRDRKGVSIQRLVERYAEYDQTGFLVKKRTGGQVVLAEAFRLIKIAA